MARISFTSNLNRHVTCPIDDIKASTLQEILHVYFERHQGVREYILDDQGTLRKHVVIYLDGEAAKDRVTFSDPIASDSEVFVFQALSGG